MTLYDIVYESGAILRIHRSIIAYEGVTYYEVTLYERGTNRKVGEGVIIDQYHPYPPARNFRGWVDPRIGRKAVSLLQREGYEALWEGINS